MLLQVVQRVGLLSGIGLLRQVGLVGFGKSKLPSPHTRPGNVDFDDCNDTLVVVVDRDGSSEVGSKLEVFIWWIL